MTASATLGEDGGIERSFGVGKIERLPDISTYEILIIAEANVWHEELKSIPVPYNPDPLIVIIHNKKAYLVDCFDVTQIEDYVSKEFKI